MNRQNVNDVIERIWAIEQHLTQASTGLAELEQIIADQVTDLDSE